MIFFTEEQKKFCCWAREFATNELAEGARERQKLDYIKPEMMKKLGDAGFLELGLSKQYSKRLTDCVTLGIAMEEICKVDYTLMNVLLIQVVVNGLAEYMTPETRDAVMGPSARGETLLCFANTEPNCGSDAAAIKTEAIRDGEHYIINGEKTSISGGMQSDAVFITAKTDPDAGVKGISLFYVPLTLPGIDRSMFYDMGNSSSGRASLFFDQVRVPAFYRIGNEGEGFTKVMRTFDMSRALVSLGAIGLAEASLAEAIEYVKLKTAFGHNLGDFQGISFRLAEHATAIEASRLICYKTLKLRDEGEPHIKEAAMTKIITPTSAVEATHDAMLILGWKGYTESRMLEQRWKDAISTFLGDGTKEIMKVIVARELLGSRKGPTI